MSVGHPERWWTDHLANRRRPQAFIFPKGIDNPFYSFANTAKSRFVSLQLGGEAVITNTAWIRWNDNGGRIGGEEPERTRTMTYADIARLGGGWKLHLNFDPLDAAKTQKVGTCLTALKESDAITDFKLGKSSKQLGKEATVYVGHRDKAQIVAELIEEALIDVLDLPEGDATKSDIPLTDKVMGRFEVYRVDPDFHQYGGKGHPILKSDMDEFMWENQSLSEMEKERFINEAAARAEHILSQRYGVFYTGVV